MTGEGGHPRACFGVRWPRLLVLTCLSHISEPEPSPQVASGNGVSAGVCYVVFGSHCGEKQEDRAGRSGGAGIKGPEAAPQRAPTGLHPSVYLTQDNLLTVSVGRLPLVCEQAGGAQMMEASKDPVKGLSRASCSFSGWESPWLPAALESFPF